MKPHFTDTRLYSAICEVIGLSLIAAVLFFVPLRLIQIAGGV